MAESQKVFYSREKLNTRGITTLEVPGATPGAWFEAQPNRRELMLAAWNLVDVEWPTAAAPTIEGVRAVRIGSGFRRGQVILARCPRGHIAQYHITRGSAACGTCDLRRRSLLIYCELVEIFGEVFFCHRDNMISPPLRLWITAGEPYCRKIMCGGFEYLHVSVSRSRMRYQLIAAIRRYPREGIRMTIMIHRPEGKSANTVNSASNSASELESESASNLKNNSKNKSEINLKNNSEIGPSDDLKYSLGEKPAAEYDDGVPAKLSHLRYEEFVENSFGSDGIIDSMR